MEGLKSVEYEVAHVLIHVGLHYAAIKIIDHTTTVHHLEQNGTVDKKLRRNAIRKSSNLSFLVDKNLVILGILQPF